MKKLLTIVLVLALAPMAFGNASLTSGGKASLELGNGKDVTVGSVITVDMTFDAELTGLQYVDFVPGAANVGDVAPTIAVGAWAPCLSQFADNGTLTAGDIMDAAGFIPSPWSLGTGGLGVATGTVLYSFQATVNGTGQIAPEFQGGDLYYDINNPTGTNYGLTGIGMVIIPEPMTIALLGLGGLFLVRRRK